MEERRPHSQDDQNDTFLFEKLQEHVLENYPNPNRIGCLDQATLETWVFHPERLDLSDPKYLHVLKCAECTRELLELRKLKTAKGFLGDGEKSEQRAQAANWRWAIAAAILCCIAIAGLAYWRIQSRMELTGGIPADPFPAKIDLSRAGTTRGGETSNFSPVTLPRRVIAAHILLPYFSPGGSYIVAVTTDRNGSPPRAEGRGVAAVQGFQAELDVRFDLRGLPDGNYYLTTMHANDRASYFYPLTVR